MGMLEIALALFFIANPVGGVPVFVSLVKDFDFRKQKIILFREALISMALAYFFLFLGEPFVQKILHIDPFAIKIAGGAIVFLISVGMIFPVHTESKGSKVTTEPFVVPIATPLISGAGVFATIVVLSKQAPLAVVSGAIFIAWIAVIAIVVSSAFLQKVLGKRGLIALEQFMGLLLMLMSMELFLGGLHLFMLRIQGV